MNTETIDPTTGEVRKAEVVVVAPAPLAVPTKDELLSAAAIVRRIADPATPLEAIPRDLLVVNEMARRFREFAAACNTAALARMNADEAKEIVGDGVRMKVTPDHRYEYEEARLMELQNLVGVPGGISVKESELALRRVLKPDKAALNAIVKRGGPAKRIIEVATKDKGTPKLEVEAVE